MERFWVCYVDGTDGGRHCRHYILEEAQKEAERLTRKEIGKVVYLLECVGKCKVKQTPVEWAVPR